MHCRIIPLFKGNESFFELPEGAGESGKTTMFRARTKDESNIIVLGLGDENLTAEKIRFAAGCLTKFLRDLKVPVEAELEEPEGADAEFVECFYEGFLLGTYRFDKYFGSEYTRHEISLKLGEWELAEGEIKSAIARAEITAKGVIFARDLSNELPEYLYPETFCQQMKKHFKGTEVEVVIHDHKDLEKMEMQGILSVGRGSNKRPALAELRYCTAPEKPLLALVGKGVTFDMGGMNLKIARDLSDSRMDMGGAAAVAGAMELLASRGAKANVIALIPLAENLPGTEAIVPSHTVKYKNGMTVQIANTDAEGRLLLADALLYAGEKGAVEAIDIATLTGNIGVALGTRISGVFGDDEFAKELCEKGNQVGDPVWHMPLIKDYLDDFDSYYADTINITNTTTGGAICAALFLQKFVSDMKWAHLDIAATAGTKKMYSYHPAGATGFGARLLASYASK